MLAYGAVQLDLLVADGGGAGIGSGGAGLGGKRPHGLHHPVQRPFEVDRGRARRKQPVMGGIERGVGRIRAQGHRSEEHTSELQSLMRISYAVFCLKKKTPKKPKQKTIRPNKSNNT